MLLLARPTGAEEVLTERAGYLLDLDRSRDAIVLGTRPGDTAGLSLQTDSDTVVFKESPAKLADIVRGTSLSVVGAVNGSRIQVTRLTALAVSPEEGRYKKKVVGRLERQNGQHSLLVNEAVYQLGLSKNTVVLRHEKVGLYQLQPGQGLVVTVQDMGENLSRARQIIYQPSAEEKLEKEQILL